MSANQQSLVESVDRPVFHLTHRENLPRIISEGGIRAPGNSDEPYPYQVWSDEFRAARGKCALPFGEGLSLDEFVAFSFCTKTPAVYNVATGWNGITRTQNRDLVFLRTTPRMLMERMVPLVSSDRMPLKRDASFSAGAGALACLDWALVGSGSFQKDAGDPDRSARAGAELLAYATVPMNAIDTVICWDEQVTRETIERGCIAFGVQITLDRHAFFSKGA